MQGLTMSQSAENKYLWSSQTEMRHLTLFPPKTHGTLSKRKQKDCESQRLGRTRTKQCLLDMTGPLHSGIPHSCGCLHKTTPVNIEKGSGRGTWASPHSSTDTDNWWLLGEGKPASLGVWPLVDWPCSSGWPVSHLCIMGSTNWTQDMKLWGRAMRKHIWEELEGECGNE